LLFLAVALTYEVVFPLIAIAGALYLATGFDRRRALWRGAFDLVLALGFTCYRMFIADVSSTFVVKRTPGEWVDRLLLMWRGAWNSWHTLFVPGTVGLVVALMVLGAIAAVAVTNTRARVAMRPWAIVAVACAAYALIAVSAYVTANYTYVPQPSTTYNRLNLAAAPAYCGIAVALLSMLFIAVRSRAPAVVAGAAVALVTVGFAQHQVRVERDSQASWERSWTDQIRAINTFKRISGALPRNASILSFGHPIYEANWIPVLSTGWDLRGAIDLETPIDPPKAIPWIPGVECGATSVVFDGRPYMPYGGRSPVYAFNPGVPALVPLHSAADCRSVLAQWGPPPYVAPPPT
jgi:hypothetical protein